MTGERPVRKTAVIPSLRPSAVRVTSSPGLAVAWEKVTAGKALTGRVGLDEGQLVMNADARE